MFGITSRHLLAVLMVVLMLAGVATAVSIVSLNNPGHVRILKGNRADLLVTPSTIEFGNVTVGDPANVTVWNDNRRTCQLHGQSDSDYASRRLHFHIELDSFMLVIRGKLYWPAICLSAFSSV